MATRPATEALEQVADPLALDAATVQTRVEAVLAEELYWFPVRHHSPAVARYLEAVLLERRPKLVFIEGPAEANDLIPHVVDSGTKPPIAIYSSYRDDNNTLGLAGIASPAPDIPARFACWYPMLPYSPEYVAMQIARQIKARPVFIDLPHHALLKPAKLGEPGAPPTDEKKKEASKPKEFETERLLAESGFFQRLAAAAGYDTWNEAWDSLFEMREFTSAEEFRRELAVFCCAARATTAPARIQNDDTLPRERHMLQTIRATLRKEKIAPRDAMVVCGGFHLFMDRADPADPPTPPPGTVYTTVVPYSYFRVSELSGYGAGNRAPQFYQRWWDLVRAGRGEHLAVEHTVAVLKATRKSGAAASSADAIAICQHARMLARLRGRANPVLDDLRDAAITCVCKGNPTEEGDDLLAAMDQVEIGNAIGKVTAALGRLPIVEDFHRQLADLALDELTAKEKKLKLKLDKRVELDQRRSAFLHRVCFLEVEIGGRTDGGTKDLSTGKIFGETWALQWHPNVEGILIERSLLGDTIEAAVLAKLREEIARDDLVAGRICARLVQAIDMDLPTMIAEVQHACGKAIDADARFASLAQALGSLGLLDQYAIFRGLKRDRLEELMVRCFDRATFALPEAASVPEEQQNEVVGALQTVAEVLGRADHLGLDRRQFVQSIRQAAHDSTVPFLRGAFLGMLTELRDIAAEDLAKEISALARAPVEIMITAGDFLDGVLAVSRTSIMLGADALIGAVDDLLRAADWEPFLVMLPRMRAAFERLSKHQVSSLASTVAERYGLKESATLTELSMSVGAAAAVARIDQKVAAIMAQWGLT